MYFFDKLFRKQKSKNPEDEYEVIITKEYVRVKHPQRRTQQIFWKNIQHIKIINTDAGPWSPDIWLAFMGKEESCLIPQGAKGFDEAYDIVSKYDGFNFENFIQSMSCTENAEFDLWTNQEH